MWTNYKIKTHKRMRKHIMDDPYGCDRCGDTYNINDLKNIQDDRICMNCMEDNTIAVFVVGCWVGVFFGILIIALLNKENRGDYE